MVRPPCFNSNGIKSGIWSKEEDDTLRAFVRKHGHRNWQKLPLLAGLARSGKSCRLRWVNYLQPGLKKDNFSKEEVDLIITLHNQLGNKWSAIAEKLPGRTDNDIKNHWHAHIKKRDKRTKLEMGHDEQQSFEISCCNKSDYQGETCGQSTIVESYDYMFFSTDVPPFPEEKFNDFGLRHNGTPTFSNSSDGGITYDDLPLISEEEFSDLGLCHNDTPTLSDSSESGSGMSTYDDHRYLSSQLNIHLPPFRGEELFDMAAFSDSSDSCFSQLDIDLPPLISEEIFCAFGLRHNDTPTFSDSSDGGITQDHTCFNHMSIDPPTLISEEEFSDFSVFTPTFSDPDSSDSGITSSNQIEVLGLSQLERAWYFGDDV